jgi:hypothetical protein
MDISRYLPMEYKGPGRGSFHSCILRHGYKKAFFPKHFFIGTKLLVFFGADPRAGPRGVVEG